MYIYLHSPGHNGDILACSQVIYKLVIHNPTFNFIIVVACSTCLFDELINNYKNVQIKEHPVPWNGLTNIPNDENSYIHNQHHTIYSIYNNNLYINLWKLFIYNNTQNMDINRINLIQDVLNEICVTTTIKLSFPVDNFKELIPIIPSIDISFIINSNKLLNKKIIFYYNIKACASSLNINDDVFIDYLLSKYSDSVLLVPKKTDIIHDRLISLETEFNILPDGIRGYSLAIYANLCRFCSDVYLKNTGGNYYILNKENIETLTNYNLFIKPDDDHVNVIKNSYGLQFNIIDY